MRRLLSIVLIFTSLTLNAQKVGISLCGGAALGYAHLGFLQAMEEAGIQPDCVSGTSMGAIIGMMYAAGYSPLEIKELIHKEHMDKLIGLFRLDLRRNGGIMGTEHIQKLLLKYVPHNNFDSLKIRFYCCSSNMNLLQPYYQGHGDRLVQHVMASAAIPGIFAPVLIDSTYYFDGFFHDNMPVQPLIDEHCDRRIGSYIILEHNGKTNNHRRLWMHAYNYIAFATSQKSIPLLTDVITIDPGSIWVDDFKKLEELYQIGYQAGKTYFENQISSGIE